MYIYVQNRKWTSVWFILCFCVCVCVLLELIIIIIIFKCLFLMYRKCYLYAFRINVFLRCIKIPGNDIKENNTKIELVINSLKHVRFKRVQHNNRVQWLDVRTVETRFFLAGYLQVFFLIVCRIVLEWQERFCILCVLGVGIWTWTHLYNWWVRVFTQWSSWIGCGFESYKYVSRNVNST